MRRSNNLKVSGEKYQGIRQCGGMCAKLKFVSKLKCDLLCVLNIQTIVLASEHNNLVLECTILQ